MSIGDELEKLRALHDRGALSDAEYAAAKARVVGGAAEGGAQGGVGSSGGGTSPRTGDTPNDFLHQLHRSRSDRWLGGVCGGLARQLGLPSWFIRLLFALSFCMAGIGFVFYIVCWIFIPEDPVSA